MDYQEQPFCQKVIVEEISFPGPLAVNGFMSIQEIMINCYREGKKKLRQNTKQIIILSLITGIQFCLGIHAALMIITDMDSKTYTIDNKTETLLYTTKHSYSYTRILLGTFVPIGLILTNIIGGDLFVENLFYFSLGIMNNSMKISKILINLFLTYFLNLIGALFYTLFLGYLANQFDSEIMKEQLNYLTTKKLDLGVGYTLVNGIGAGVALGISFLLTNGSRTVICKMSSLWLPYLTIISVGFEHYIENFFLIGCSFMYGIDGSVAKFLFINILPVTLGNIIGIVGIIAVTYSVMFFSKEQQKKFKCLLCDQYN